MRIGRAFLMILPYILIAIGLLCIASHTFTL